MFIKENLNPLNKNVQDCVIRSMAKVLNQPWRRTYIELAVYGYAIADLPSADAVWNVYLLDKGLKKYVLPSDCPNCMTVREFSERYKEGRYSSRGYSYAEAKEDMIAELKELAKKAPDEKTKQELEHFANEMESK